MLLKPETENGKGGTGNGKRETGNGKGRTGNGERGTGNGEQEKRKGERATGNWEQAWGTGKKGRNLNLLPSPIRNPITPLSVMFTYFNVPVPRVRYQFTVPRFSNIVI